MSDSTGRTNQRPVSDAMIDAALAALASTSEWSDQRARVRLALARVEQARIRATYQPLPGGDA